MKKIIFFFLVMLMPFSVWALTKEDMQEIQYKEVFEISLPDGYHSFQGFIVTDKYFVVAAIKSDEDKTALFIYDKNTLQMAQLPKNPIVEYSFGHANDMAYNAKEKEIYIINKNIIHVLNDTSFEELRQIKLPQEFNAIAYDNGGFYFRYYLNAYKFNFDLSKDWEFSMPTNLTRQNVAVHNDLYYFSCFENGSANDYQDMYDGVLEEGANAIYVYSFDGKLKNTFYIPRGYGELEGIEFDQDTPYVIFNDYEQNKAVIYTPVYDSVHESLVIKDESDDGEEQAALYGANGYIEAVNLKDGVYSFKPITYNGPGVYEYTVVKLSKERDVQEEINIQVAINYDVLTNQLKSNVVSDQDGFKKANDAASNVIDTDTVLPSSSNSLDETEEVENPKTGSYLPISVLIAVTFLFGGIFFVKKNKFRKL